MSNDLTGRTDHWTRTHAGKAAEDASWFQCDPAVSLRLLTAAGLGPGRSLVDVGGGTSVLVDRALDLGVTDVTVLDIAETALAESRTRLGLRADQVTWLADDVLTWAPARRFDLWHDRAVFHFLTDQRDRDRYRQTLHDGLAKDGRVVIGTFAQDGPRSCSGLPVANYDCAALAREFEGFDVVQSEREEHRTPWGTTQPFTWVSLRLG